MINAKFRNINRLFFLSYKNGDDDAYVLLINITCCL